jgi:DNA repair and recombination protein RAD52
MTFTPEQIAALKAPLDRQHVKQRSQAGRSLSYVEGWHAIAEANRIFGFDAWDRKLASIKQLGDAREIDGKWRVAYMATVRIKIRMDDPPDYITRDGTGYGSGIDKDLGSAHESALKEAETDAMKRALMTFGNPFGLALYDKEQRAVVDTPAPDSDEYSMAIEAMKKNADRPSLRAWMAAQKDVLREILGPGERAKLMEEYAAYGKSLPEDER